MIFNYSATGKRFKTAMQNTGITAQDLSKKYGVELGYTRRILRGAQPPSVIIFYSFKKALGVSSSFLLMDNLKACNMKVYQEWADKLQAMPVKEAKVMQEFICSYLAYCKNRTKENGDS